MPSRPSQIRSPEKHMMQAPTTDYIVFLKTNMPLGSCSPWLLASIRGLKRYEQPWKYLHRQSCCRGKRITVNKLHPAQQASWPGSQRGMLCPGPRFRATALATPMLFLASRIGTLREPMPGWPVCPGADVSLCALCRVRKTPPCRWQEGGPASGTSLVLTFHSCFYWQRDPPNMTGDSHSQVN